jgi:hypothetical protein
MRAGLRAIVFVALVVGLVACVKASEEECEAACLHYSKLGLAEEESLELGSNELEQAWADRLEREELEQGLMHCTQMCRGQASPGQTSCILEADSLADADDCSGVSRARNPGDDE